MTKFIGFKTYSQAVMYQRKNGGELLSKYDTGDKKRAYDKTIKQGGMSVDYHYAIHWDMKHSI